jgi:sugar lactone lactonase YvrE
MAENAGWAEVVVRATAEVGEGPVIDPRTGHLAWVDIPAGVLHISDLRTGADRTASFDTGLGAVAPRVEPGWAAAVSDGFAVIHDTTLTLVDPVLPETWRRMNDAKCDPRGRMWAGSTALDFRAGAGALHRWDGREASMIMTDGLTLPNGMGWSPDSRLMYLADSTEKVVYRASFDADDGVIGPLQPLFWVDAGLPDGLCVAADGCIWLAVWGQGQVQRRAPDGTLLHQIRMPVSQPSSCAIAPDGILYVTSARGGLAGQTLEAEPLAGSVFAVSIGVGPVPIAPFAA